MNNLFITSEPEQKITSAEQHGFPRNICSWIKGIYTVACNAQIDEVIGVTQGDCSNTHSLMSMLQDYGKAIFNFSFPMNKDYAFLDAEISRLETHFGVTRAQTLKVKSRLDSIRQKLSVLDEMTWKENLVTGAENHYWLVSASDFMGNPDVFEESLHAFIEQAKTREPYKPKLRIAYLGVPPIFSNMYETLHNMGGEILYNEIQRQFAMLSLQPDIVQQYLEYTYPYSVFDRIKDIQTECDKRQITAIISYNQAFCHRQIDNILLKKYLNIPFLTLEGDQPGEVDSRTLLRIESFMEVYE